MNLVIKQFVYQNPDMLWGWGVGLWLCAVYAAFVIAMKSSYWVSIAYMYAVSSGLNLVFNPSNPYYSDPFYYIPICYSSLIAILCLTVLSFVTLSLKKEALIVIIHGIPLFSVLNAVYVILGAIFGFGRLPESSGYSGFLNYSGMNAVLIACGLPFLLKWDRMRVAGILLCLVAIVLSFSSVPYGVIGVMGAAYCLKKRLLPHWVWAIVGILGLLGVALLDPTLFNSGHRFEAYKIFMGAWWHYGNVWAGNGFGSFQAIESTIQENNRFMPGAYWSWMHSDILQAFWELGLIGGGVVLVAVWQTLKKLYHSEHPAMFAMACGLVSSAVFDFPVRYFSLAFLCAFAVCFAWRKDYFYAEECY